MIESEVTVIGGGIVGLAIANEILDRSPEMSVVLLEKEPALALHQTGRNSGVIHSGIYYAPGSSKAKLARAGCDSMKRFCRDNGVPQETTGKLIVAVDESEIPALYDLEKRGRENGVRCSILSGLESRAIEPSVECVKSLHVPEAGIVDYSIVSDRLRVRIERRGGRVMLHSEVKRIDRRSSRIEIGTDVETIVASQIVNAGGLHSDRIARLDGIRPRARIIPFRGDYRTVTGSSAHLVRGLIYPVPDVRYPFLGVHLTRAIDGTVHAGPNAVLALAREGYLWRDVSVRDLTETLMFPGFWRFVLKHRATAVSELRRSVSSSRFAQSVRRLVPAIDPLDLEPAASGVRAQALSRDGSLVDDFLIETRNGAVHVLNAPSPAATSSLEIARIVVETLQLRG